MYGILVVVYSKENISQRVISMNENISWKLSSTLVSTHLVAVCRISERARLSDKHLLF